jgi:hypothetical protein
MVNYQKGKIYRIIDNTNGNVYIGSTCSTSLAQRLVEHKSKYRLYTEKSIGYNVSSFEILKNGDYKIILVEDYPCDNKDQLRAREQYWIDISECVNKHRAFISPKDCYLINREYNKKYYQENKQEILKKTKQYSDNNKEYILQYKKQYYQKKKLESLQQTEEVI